MSEVVPPAAGCAICALAKKHALTLLIVGIAIGAYLYYRQKAKDAKDA